MELKKYLQEDEKVENQILFIIIGNDQWVISENICYLNNLVIPENMNAEYVIINETENIPNAFQKGMIQSSAKYKIYLDQNAFIIDKEFLVKAIKTFNEYKNIAMIGSCGFYKKDSQSEMEVKGHYVYMGNDSQTSYVKESGKEENTGITEVVTLDEHFIMTAIDTPWRGDNNNFNIIKSVELRHMDYKTAILIDDMPQVLFDNGILNE